MTSVDAIPTVLARLRSVFSVAYVRFVFSLITVEPALFLFSAAMDVLGLVRVNGLYWKICEQKYGTIAGVNCYEKKHGMKNYMRESVQNDVAMWGLYTSLAHMVPVAIVAPIYGAFTDKHGRKTVILLATTGIIIMEVVYIAEYTWVQLPIWILPVAAFLTTFAGYHGTLASACYAYVSDRELNKDRLTVRFSILQVASSLAASIMGFSISRHIEHMSYSRIPIISIIFSLAAFFYCLIFLREVPPKIAEAIERKKLAEREKGTTGQLHAVRPSTSSLNALVLNEKLNELTEPKPAKISTRRKKVRNPIAIWSLTKESVRTALKPREGHFRAYIWLLVIAFFFIVLSTHAQGQIMHLFMLDKPLYWSTQQQAVFNGFTNLVRLFGTFISVAVLKRFGFHETSILLIAVSSMTIKLLLVGSAQTNVTMYVASVLGFAGFLGFFVCKSFISQIVPNDEIGKIYALFQLVNDVAHLAGQFGLMGIYIATRHIFPGLVFYVMAATKIVAFAIILWIHVDYWRYRKAKRAAAKEAERVAGLVRVETADALNGAFEGCDGLVLPAINLTSGLVLEAPTTLKQDD